ncbi:RNA polymerase sigma factor [Brachybacterium paraconglomeratum]|uniref:RNA polymerase sigma factor n=1 Tax=Brachybacterium paraconglomeratum TaxID=173362 RepID=UPI0022E888CE|nr:sigma-70 family RNA polymerase sigma factor [Brachybacterium paraconglomeratum]
MTALLEDHVLVLRAQDGDVDAFEQLVDRHQARLFRIAFMVLHDRMDAEDVVQEALVSSWKRLHLLRDPDSFRAWISQITSRAATDIVRQKARRQTDAAQQQDLDTAATESALGGTSGRNAHQPERAAMAAAQMEALATILQTIPEDQRTSWVLREIDGMSYADIARIVDATETAVRGRIARARTQILDRMQEYR